MSDNPKVGSVGWIDLTVSDATKTRDFYSEVVGLQSSDVDMGGYADYTMSPPGGDPACGICHAKGVNADLPPAWMLYFVVADLDRSIDACRTGGGEIVVEPKSMGGARYCVIRDPAGAICALYQP